jgi:hypothetical protein
MYDLRDARYFSYSSVMCKGGDRKENERLWHM